MMPRNLLLISSSRVHGFGYLENVSETLKKFLKKFNVNQVLFVPYAGIDYESYVNIIRNAFIQLEIKSDVFSIHEASDPVAEVNKAQAIFVGGGNTFLLLKTLYEKNLVEAIRKKVLQDGIPYIGSSAGTNVATVSINTTNDMPIVYPPSFQALGLVPFNINPHFLDEQLDSKHMGETRTDRILEYLKMPNSHPVLGLREGSSILVDGSVLTLIGEKSAKLFRKDEAVQELPPHADLSFLLSIC